MTYIPRSATVDDYKVRSDVEQFFRRMRLKAHFHDRDEDEQLSDSEIPRAPRRSNWTPPQGKFAALDLYIDKCRHDISKIYLQKRCHKSNLPTHELKALLDLRRNPEYVIKPADKGGATVVWRRDLYLQEGYRQLSDTNTYLPLTEDPTASDLSLVTSTIKDFVRSKDLPSSATELGRSPLCPVLYAPQNSQRQ